ncbi:glycosyltransferase family 2 protein [Candidatus Micrarchaeota archaeon]|nr:glycosyltransferase family 2 protein [Candidatus Micrarchaeota archaeon]
MKESPLISVIVPVGKSRLGELGPLKKSLENQTYKNYELIVQVGPSAAVNRNLGAKKSKGAILLFLDSDMSLSKGMLKFVLDSLEKKRFLIFWRATAFTAIFREDFVPFDPSFRFAEDNMWFWELENKGVRPLEIIKNRDQRSAYTDMKKSFWYPFEWRKIPGNNMLRALTSAMFDILKRMLTISGIILSAFIRK